MIEIDGSQGEGGGQIVRTALSLAACIGKAVRIRHIRQGRKKPGLMRQHLACVNAIRQVCNGRVHGASIGSRELLFEPGVIAAGDYRFSVGSAGSTCLVLQTVLPALMQSGKSSTIVMEGGTHNPLAPSYHFIERAFMPVLMQKGLRYEMAIERYGFYPVGAGAWRINLTPPQHYQQWRIEDRGRLVIIKGFCLSAKIPEHVVERERKQLIKSLDLNPDNVIAEQVDSLGAGNIVLLQAEYERICEVTACIGSVGVGAERVAKNAVDLLRRYQSGGAPVSQHLADQLLLPLLVGGGGSFVTTRLTEHCFTNIAVIEQMTGVKIDIAPLSNGRHFQLMVPMWKFE